MTTLADLYREAECSDITVDRFALPGTRSLSLMDEDGSCHIGMDHHLPNGSGELSALVHELGHCKTGAFYNQYSSLCCIHQQEARAWRWAVQRVLPRNELNNAIQSGLTEVWQLAEHFGVEESLVRYAFSLYFEQ